MKPLSKTLFATSLLALFMSVGLVACKKNKAADLSGNYSIIKGRTLEIKPVSQTAVTISIVAIEDTRCPPNAFCASAGSAQVTLKIKDLSIGAEKTVTLHLGYPLPKEKEKKDMAKVNLNGNNYIIQFKYLFPYPGANNNEQTVDIMLSKL